MASSTVLGVNSRLKLYVNGATISGAGSITAPTIGYDLYLVQTKGINSNLPVESGRAFVVKAGAVAVTTVAGDSVINLAPKSNLAVIKYGLTMQSDPVDTTSQNNFAAATDTVLSKTYEHGGINDLGGSIEFNLDRVDGFFREQLQQYFYRVNVNNAGEISAGSPSERATYIIEVLLDNANQQFDQYMLMSVILTPPSIEVDFAAKLMYKVDYKPNNTLLPTLVEIAKT